MKKAVSIIIIVIIAAAVVYALMKAQKPTPVQEDTTQVMDTQNTQPADDGTIAATDTRTQADGLQITTLKEGNGQEVKVGDTVSVYYTGTFTDGKVFDGNVGKDPIEFPIGVGMVIKGWDEGVVGMKVGEKRKLYIPWKLAYGESGRPPVIPAKSDLVFEIELVGIK